MNSVLSSLSRRVRVPALLVVLGAAAWLARTGYGQWRHHYARIDFPQVDRVPALREPAVRPLARVPRHDPAATNPFHADLRMRDLSAADLSASEADLLEAAYDTATRWPDRPRLPAGFDPERFLELGRNPGLGVRRLHAQGVTGRGVGLAVIDQVLPTQHPEYADRLRLYEEADDIWWPFNQADMHGAAVASLAVGRSVGVAPEAELYYLATRDGQASPMGLLRRLLHRDDERAGLDFRVLARCIRRVLLVNRQLPPGRKIRVIAIAMGWMPGLRGYEDVKAAAAEARAAGLLVVCSSMEEVHGFKFQGLGRAPAADPDAFASYGPGRFWAAHHAREPLTAPDRLLVPMDSRTTAGFTRNADYTFHRQGGWSWAIPYIAGAYALAAQVKPDITPDEFWAVALRTARTLPPAADGKTAAFGPILDPVALIGALQNPHAP